jgi:phosphate transport system protein
VARTLPKLFSETVEELEREALGELQGVVRQLDRAVEAVTRQEAQLAGQVVAGEAAADRRYRLLQERLLTALASHRAAPDLQMLASLLHVLRGLRRIAEQCTSMARLVSAAPPGVPEVTALRELVEGAAALSVSGVWLARAAFAARDVELAHEVVRLDAELGRRSRAIFQRALELADAGEFHEWAMSMLLVGSHAERVSDAAVDIAEQTVIVVHGLFREVDEEDPAAHEPARTW